MNRIFRGLAHCAAVVALIAACSKAPSSLTPDASAVSLTGLASGPANAPLSATAQFEVQLMLVDPALGPQLLASQRIRNPGGWPVNFRLDVARDKINSQKHYQLLAQVMDGGQATLHTASALDVSLAQPVNTLNFTLTPIDNGPNDAPASDAHAEPVFETRYSGSELAGITESRTAPQLQRVDYRYRGARLIEYVEQDATGGHDSVHVRFSDQGRLISAARTRDGVQSTLATAEIDEIRNRATMLRSLALAQKVSATHAK
jgi:uncharacterized lipoprotein YbaY